MTQTVDLQNDPTFGALIAAVREDVNNFKRADSEWVAANGDRDALVKDFLANSQDEKAIRFREALKELTDKFNEYAANSVKTSDVSEDEKEVLKKARAEARRTASNTIKAVSDTAGLFERQKGLPYTAALEGWLKENFGDNALKAESGAKGTGSSLPKVPVEIRVNIPATGDQPASVQDFHNFTAYATWRGTDTKTVQEEVAQAAGLAHSELSKLSGTVTYQVQRGELTLDVSVWPKETKPRGRKKAEQEPVTEQ